MGMRSRSRSSRKRLLSSVNRRSFKSAIDCLVLLNCDESPSRVAYWAMILGFVRDQGAAAARSGGIVGRYETWRWRKFFTKLQAVPTMTWNIFLLPVSCQRCFQSVFCLSAVMTTSGGERQYWQKEVGKYEEQIEPADNELRGYAKASQCVSGKNRLNFAVVIFASHETQLSADIRQPTDCCGNLTPKSPAPPFVHVSSSRKPHITRTS